MVEKGENTGEKSLAVFGTSANPPHFGHREMAQKLSDLGFDEILVVPCGPRSDKELTNATPTQHRAWMADVTFKGIPRVRVSLEDLERNEFMRTYALEQIYRKQRYKVWHAIGTDLLQGKSSPNDVRHWYRGEELWKDSKFIVFERPNIPNDASQYPPHRKILSVECPGSSSVVRERVFRGESFEEFLVPEVASYIKRYGLYRGMPPVTSSKFTFDSGMRPLIIVDRTNPKAVELASSFGRSRKDPNAIVVIGGDGTMLHAIKKFWRERLPMLGINAGHRGFLLNDVSGEGELAPELDLHQLPLLWAEAKTTEGEGSGWAFNDVWVERATGQTAWIDVRVNGEEEMNLRADGALVSTAAGSSAYARALGATVLPHGSPHLWLAGMGVGSPENFRPVLLNLADSIEFLNADPLKGRKRPLRGYIDGEELDGHVKKMSVRASRTATVELLFDPRYDLAKKLRAKQFAK